MEERTRAWRRAQAARLQKKRLNPEHYSPYWHQSLFQTHEYDCYCRWYAGRLYPCRYCANPQDYWRSMGKLRNHGWYNWYKHAEPDWYTSDKTRHSVQAGALSYPGYRRLRVDREQELAL